MKLSSVKDLAVHTFQEWKDDDAMQWSAALSYYAALAMAPLLMLALGLVSVIYDAEAAREDLLTRIGRWVGSEGAEIARTILESDRAGGVGASVTGAVLLVVGATGVFAQLQRALNDVWEVEPEKGGWKRLLMSRLLAFGLVLGIVVLLIASLAARAVLSGLPAPGFALHALNIGISVGAFTAVLAGVYKVLPDVEIEWRDVWVGALVTALLFVVGQVVIGLYLGHSAVGSAYGAAGSLVAVLVWLYFSAMVLFFGAEFTQVWARSSGRRIVPSDGARRVGEVPDVRAGDTYP